MWTREKPKTDGWYWCRVNGIVGPVRVHAGELPIFGYEEALFAGAHPDDAGAEWWGERISEPSDRHAS